LFQDESGGCPCIGQTMPGMEAARAWSAAFTWNVGRRTLTLPARAGGSAWVGDRERAKRRKP
jgi:hypothetical protein